MQKIIGRYPYSPNNNLILFYMYYVKLSREKSTFWQWIFPQNRASFFQPHKKRAARRRLSFMLLDY